MQQKILDVQQEVNEQQHSVIHIARKYLENYVNMRFPYLSLQSILLYCYSVFNEEECAKRIEYCDIRLLIIPDTVVEFFTDENVQCLCVCEMHASE